MNYYVFNPKAGPPKKAYSSLDSARKNAKRVAEKERTDVYILEAIEWVQYSWQLVHHKNVKGKVFHDKTDGGELVSPIE